MTIRGGLAAAIVFVTGAITGIVTATVYLAVPAFATPRAVDGRLPIAVRLDAGTKDGVLEDSGIGCVDGRQYLITDASLPDHRMVRVTRNGEGVPCTGGISLVIGD